MGGGGYLADFKPMNETPQFPRKAFQLTECWCIRNPICRGICVVSVCCCYNCWRTNFILWSLPQKALEGQPQLCLPLVVTVFLLLILTNRRLQRVNCIVKYSPFQLCLTTKHLFIAIPGMFLLPAAHCHGFTSSHGWLHPALAGPKASLVAVCVCLKLLVFEPIPAPGVCVGVGACGECMCVCVCECSYMCVITCVLTSSPRPHSWPTVWCSLWRKMLQWLNM